MRSIFHFSNAPQYLPATRLIGAISILCASLILSACGSDKSVTSEPVPVDPTPVDPTPEFTHMGLNEHVVKRLVLHNNGLLVATDRGLYRLDQQEQWQLLSSTDWDIYDIAIVDDLHFILSYQSRGGNHISESIDGGASWLEVPGGFSQYNETPKDESVEPAFRLLYEEGKLYGSGYDALAVSEDLGQTWQKLVGSWNGFARGTSLVARNASEGAVWYGGQGAFENPVLRRYSEGDLSLFEVSNIDDVLPVPSSVYGFAFSELSPGRVYVSGEGGIVYSDDEGENWHPLHVNDNYRFYFDFALFSESEEIFYTAGWDKNYESPQPLIVEVSRDSGMTWQSFQYDDADLLGGVYSLTAHRSESVDTLYLGLYKGGVMKVEFNRQ